MTKKTEALINELTGVLAQGRYLLLTGGSGTGKTYIAKKLAESFGAEYEVVSIHPAYSYSDFVTGLSFDAEQGFRDTDKIFLTELEKAKSDSGKKFFLILDDIGRGMITGILGDVLSLIEPHGDSEIHLSIKGKDISIPPNFYIIATKSTLTDSLEPAGYGFSRHFYHRHIESDYSYMSEDASENKTSEITSNDMFYRTRNIIRDNLRYRGGMSGRDAEKYFIGHGVFNERSTLFTMKYQVVPMLRQYIKDGILDKHETENELALIEESLKTDYIKNMCPTGNLYWRSPGRSILAMSCGRNSGINEVRRETTDRS